MSVQTAPQETKARIHQLLDELSPAKLTSVEDFVLFLREHDALISSSHYPTVENPASSLSAWLDLIPDGCRGSYRMYPNSIAECWTLSVPPLANSILTMP
jgi:hypothetical protein